jgi:multiple sugar transport system substrate-binding protein
MWRAIVPAVALLLASVGPGAAQDGSPGWGSERFDGVTVNVVTFTGPPIAEPLQRYGPEWGALTGGQVNVTTFPFSDLYQRALTDVATGTNSFQLLTLAAPWLGDFAAGGYIEDITDRIAGSPELAWEDVAPFFREYVATYGGRVYGVPIDGDFVMVYYRTDLLDQDGVSPPATWDEYLEIARQYHGQDLDGDGSPDYGSCLPKARAGVGTWHFNGVFTSFVQTEGTSQGAFFGDNMTPLVNNEAMGAALDFWMASTEVGPPDEINLDQQAARDMFVAGRCALAIDWGDMGVLAIDPATSKVIDKVGATMMPGSPSVLDRETGTLVPCDESLCPHAIDGINRAPFGAFGGWAGVINAAADERTRDAAYSFITYVSAPERSNRDVTVGVTGMNPYRTSQLESLQPWLDSGFSEAAAESYLGAIEESLASPNFVLDLRVAQANQYTNVLQDQAIAQFLAGELTKEQAMQQIFDAWEELTNQIGRESQAEAYAASLGVQP